MDNLNIINEITIIKRNGRKQEFNAVKITNRINRLIKMDPPLDFRVNSSAIVTKTKSKLNVSEITTSEIDEMTAKISYDLITIHPDYAKLAARIIVANLHKNTADCFSAYIDQAANNINTSKKGHPHTPLINNLLTKFVKNNKAILNRIVDCSRDFNFDWLGIWTLIDRYLIKKSGDELFKLARPQDFVIERPQYMFMRIACMLSLNHNYIDDNRKELFDRVESIYNHLSNGLISLATPTMKNAGTFNEQLLSCFLLRAEDNTDSIMKMASNLAKISKGAGGTGWSKNFRPLGSEVKKTNGRSAGEGPFLKIYEKVLKAFDQGGNRPGSGADYKRVWEAGFMNWIKYRRPREPDESSIRQLFYACWVDDYFMYCVIHDLEWFFVSQYEHPELVECYGEEWTNKYKSVVEWIGEDPDGSRNKYGHMKARDVWNEIITTQIESGMPYILNADRVNELSNQKNIGLIHNSNLCAEVIETCSDNRIACCCLATLPVNKFLRIKAEYSNDNFVSNQWNNNDFDSSTGNSTTSGSGVSENESPKKKSRSSKSKNYFSYEPKSIDIEQIMINKYEIDWAKFKKAIKETVWILNKVIDINDYPIEDARLANMEQRPLGIGIQGMADCAAMMKLAWDSPEWYKFCSQVAEVLHFTSLEASCELSKSIRPYPYFKPNHKLPNIEPSYLAQGIFQWEQWSSTPSGKLRALNSITPDINLMSEGITDWGGLRKNIQEHGVYNSLLNAYPPTASSSNIQGNIESFEPFKSNAYLRKTISGHFTIINKYLIQDLQKMGIWNTSICKKMIAANGSIQKITEIPEAIRNLYKTAWEIDPMVLAEISALYAPWVDQTMSDNIFIPDASDGKLITKVLLYRWQLGLKTGMYYLKQTVTKGKRKFANDSIKVTVVANTNTDKEPLFCTMDNPDCEACQS